MRIIIFALCLLSTSLFAKSDTPLVYLTWLEDPMRSMTIQWITRDKDLNDNVSYRLEERKSKNHRKRTTVTGDHRWLPQNRPYLVHRVTLRDLQPDTIYRFQVGDDSTTFRFRTMPQDVSKSVRFVIGGDACNSNIKRFRNMSHQAAKTNPRFAVIGGDIAYAAPKDEKGNSENFSRWRDFFRCWMKEMVDKDGCQIPLFVTIGNHEVKGGFNRPAEAAPFYYAFFEKTVYDFGFGDYVHFTFLDSGHTHGIQGSQKVWLEQTLKTHMNYKHRFVVYHVGAYPSVGDYDDHVRDHVRKHWVPVFEKYKIDACFESHDHAYKRTFPLLRGRMDPQGVVYFGDGSWGVNPRQPKTNRPYLARALSKQQVLVVDLYADKRVFWALDLKGKEIDRFEQPVRLR